MSSLARTLVLSTAIVVSAAPLLAQEVHTDYDHKADFSHYHTFCVDRVHAADPLYEGRLRDALNFRLTAQGLKNNAGLLHTRTDQGPAPVDVPETCDLAVRAIGSVREQREYSTFYNGFGPGWGYGGWGGGFGGWGGPWGGFGGGPAITQIEQIPVGTLVVDLYDTHTHQLVFRGIAASEYSRHADKNTRRLNISVDKMFKKFPPKGKA